MIRSRHTPAYDAPDLTTCDREPIHVPGAIQPHGLLLALEVDAHGDPDTTVMVSANVEQMLGLPVAEALGLPLARLLGEPMGIAVRQRAASTVVGDPLVMTLLGPDDRGGALSGLMVDVGVHRSGDRVVVEVEPTESVRGPVLSYQSARGAMARMAAADSVRGLADQLAREVRNLTGFDRVMVYRFDEQWNGEVIAEQRRIDLNPFLGLHYPATDIPAQARRLYTVNWTRLIADIGYEPVPLHPVLDPATGAPLDLSHSSLRSVSPIHVEYLSNIGVTASMSISLVIEDRLWGLVACHHYSGPHRPGMDARSAAEFLGQVASQQIAGRERADSRDAALAAQSELARITARISTSLDSPMETALADPALLGLVDATGIAICHAGRMSTAGRVPGPAVLRRIAAALHDPDVTAAATDHLASLDPDLADVASVAAGALLAGDSDDRWIMWLRPEIEQVVDWGGDPRNKQLAATEGADVRLSPRKSFEKWRQVVRGHSRAWTEWQVEAADALDRHLTGVMLLRSREQIVVAESLQRQVLRDTVPQYPGLALTARYLPASSYQLGGDWWDAFPLPDGRIALVVGDVAGHGVAAAGAMTQVRTALRAYLFGGDQPAASLDRLDALLSEMFDQTLATAVVAAVDAESGEVEIASAGHLPPLLVLDDRAEPVSVAGRPLLGIGWGTSEATRISIPDGGTLVLYTDGLIERRGMDLLESIDLLSRRAGEASPGDGAWTDQLLAAVPGTADDDTTLLAVTLTRVRDRGSSPR